MRLLILHLYDPHFQIGGADKGVLDLAFALQTLGNEIRILTNQGPFADEAGKRGIRVIGIPRSKWALAKMLAVIHEQIRSFRPEIFHSHHRYTTFILDVFLKKRGPPFFTRKGSRLGINVFCSVTEILSRPCQNPCAGT